MGVILISIWLKHSNMFLFVSSVVLFSVALTDGHLALLNGGGMGMVGGLNTGIVNGRYILQKMHMPGQAFNMYMAAWGLDDETIKMIRDSYPPMEVMIDDDGMLMMKNGEDEISLMDVRDHHFSAMGVQVNAVLMKPGTSGMMMQEVYPLSAFMTRVDEEDNIMPLMNNLMWF